MEVGQPTETVTITSGAETIANRNRRAKKTRSRRSRSITSRSSAAVRSSCCAFFPAWWLRITRRWRASVWRWRKRQLPIITSTVCAVNRTTSTIDGSRMIDIGANNGTVITANPDMVQEVKVQTSNYAAEHGTSAVQISATTKGGSSDFPRLALRLPAQLIDSRPTIARTRINGVARPKSKYNYPGGNIGGPILLPWTNFNRNRDKLFFFVGYERYCQQVDEGSKLFRVPTFKERAGDFSESAPGVNLRSRRLHGEWRDWFE